MSEMITQERASVGILIAVRTHSGKPAVVLQQRTDTDSFARGCQVTAAGKLEAHELKLPKIDALNAALDRELREELGDKVASMIEASKTSVQALNEQVSAKGQLVVTSGWDSTMNSDAFLKLVVKGPEVGGFVVCEDPKGILPLEKSHKDAGVPAGEIRMFPDEIEAVKTFFSKLFGK